MNVNSDIQFCPLSPMREPCVWLESDFPDGAGNVVRCGGPPHAGYSGTPVLIVLGLTCERTI